MTTDEMLREWTARHLDPLGVRRLLASHVSRRPEGLGSSAGWLRERAWMRGVYMSIRDQITEEEFLRRFLFQRHPEEEEAYRRWMSQHPIPENVVED